MSRLIDADAAIDALRDYLVEKRCPDDGTLTCRLIENEVINKLPSAQPEPCEDAVSKEAVLSMIDTYMNKSVELHYLPTSDGIKKLISILPSIQPERKTGRWIPTYEDCCADVWVKWKCSECGYVRKKGWKQTYDGAKPDALFCEMCNADMRGEQE